MARLIYIPTLCINTKVYNKHIHVCIIFVTHNLLIELKKLLDFHEVKYVFKRDEKNNNGPDRDTNPGPLNPLVRCRGLPHELSGPAKELI